jgi:hypothetical protein
VFITETQCVYCAVRTGFLHPNLQSETNKPNADITMLSTYKRCLYADWLTEKRTFEEVSWTAGRLPLKVTQSSRGRHARRIMSACGGSHCLQSWLPFTEPSFPEVDDHWNRCHQVLHLHLLMLPLYGSLTQLQHVFSRLYPIIYYCYYIITIINFCNWVVTRWQ